MLLTAVNNADVIRIVRSGALAAYFPSNEKSAAQVSLPKCCFSGLQRTVQWDKCIESLAQNATCTVEKQLHSCFYKKRPFETELSPLSLNWRLVNQTAVNRNGITAKILICSLKGQASISFGSRETRSESEILFAKFH